LKDYTIVNIEEVIKLNSKGLGEAKILAHTADDKKSETLSEHTGLSVKYLKRLLEERKLKLIVDRLANDFFSETEPKLKSVFKKLFANVIVFHDFGKINPFYQRNVLHNKIFPTFNIECLDGNRHSLLSSVIYFDYFINEVNQEELTEPEKKKLKYFVFLNSFIISRHHSNLDGSGKEEKYLDVYYKSFIDNNAVKRILDAINRGDFSELYSGPFLGKKNYKQMIKNSKVSFYQSFEESIHKKIAIYVYAYVRFLYSLLISCDYYATSEYKTGIEIRDYGNLDEIYKINQVYESTERIRRIRKHDHLEDDGKDINYLRNEMFLECEKNLIENMDKKIFFLEAPTGSGKSNMSVNVSLKLLDDKIQKIIYVYPFNTLIEQNLQSLTEIFKGSHVMEQVAVINSVHPINRDKNEIERLKAQEDEDKFYQKTLLDRQFLNYPFVLTTHVNLFDIMFGCSKESAISFYQLSNSVIVLDEIQSYKNYIWTEIMYFLQCFSDVLNLKVIIMSATLPKMDYLTEINNDVVSLITNRKRYFEDKRFKDRVKISFELLDISVDFEKLAEHMMNNSGRDRNILVEFIKKDSAYKYFEYLNDNYGGEIKIYCLTGDYNQADREKILKEISSSKGNILVATQVVEAGVDIDMDIGYKDISKLDSEEQFLGRINRNYKSGFGMAYFFQMDSTDEIYKDDFRIEPEFTILVPEMQEILLNKEFDIYYQKILKRIKESRNMRLDEKGITAFMEDVKKLYFYEIQKRMKLIKEDEWHISVFISRVITLSDGTVINGDDVWEEYKNLLSDNEMDYAKKQVKLSDVKCKFSYFIFKVKRDCDFNHNDRIGELYFLQDGEKYLTKGYLDMDTPSLFV